MTTSPPPTSQGRAFPSRAVVFCAGGLIVTPWSPYRWLPVALVACVGLVVVSWRLENRRSRGGTAEPAIRRSLTMMSGLLSLSAFIFAPIPNSAPAALGLLVLCALVSIAYGADDALLGRPSSRPGREGAPPPAPPSGDRGATGTEA